MPSWFKQMSKRIPFKTFKLVISSKWDSFLNFGRLPFCSCVEITFLKKVAVDRTRFFFNSHSGHWQEFAWPSKIVTQKQPPPHSWYFLRPMPKGDPGFIFEMRPSPPAMEHSRLQKTYRCSCLCWVICSHRWSLRTLVWTTFRCWSPLSEPPNCWKDFWDIPNTTLTLNWLK